MLTTDRLGRTERRLSPSAGLDHGVAPRGIERPKVEPTVERRDFVELLSRMAGQEPGVVSLLRVGGCDERSLTEHRSTQNEELPPEGDGRAEAGMILVEGKISEKRARGL
jgi:hypothetical protein